MPTSSALQETQRWSRIRRSRTLRHIVVIAAVLLPDTLG